MPRGTYILCCESLSQDKDTFLISLFRVVEKVIVTPLVIQQDAKGVMVVEKPPLHIVAGWMLNQNDDPGQEYEYELSFIAPDNATIDLNKGKFYFTKSRPIHRFVSSIQGPLPIKSAGLMFAECKIRKVGDSGWLRQNYPIIVEIGPQAVLPTSGDSKDGPPDQESTSA